MTSFESASPDDLDDQTPPEDSATAAKQLGRDNAVDRHPHAISTSPGLAAATNGGDPSDRSPISDIKYPKVPRASNQAVPRTSPNTSARAATPSPRIAQQGGQPSPPPPGTSSPAQATLLARRRGDAGGLLIDSGASTPAGGASKQATPSSSSKGAPRTPEGQKAQDTEQARKSSAALPVEERWRQGGGEGDVAIKTPLWVPRLTPTRRGDDLYLAVAYASREGIN
ncbi:uncharacterized protein LTHEOB_9774 [Neofusicoccum parvum]|uniref:Uncharacterized protein LTHEOB_9774 n=1 Tax=Neofusicoccum parvum TaxID=310453 RepID=A0ACB5SF72_9PEZI|nr:uncharacterized protein LTHEOB_9774 [Neofusicoccum parvum]